MREWFSPRAGLHVSLVLLVALLVAAFLPHRTVAAPAGGTKWALLVGVDQYQREDVTPLKFAVADVKAIAAELVASCSVPEDNIFLLSSDRRGDNAPTRTNVAFRLDWLAGRVKPGDSVFFFFSGHGVETDGASYLMTCEADPRSVSTLEQSGLNAQWLQKKLAAIPAERLLVVIDACRNDPRSDRGTGDNKLGKGMARDLTVVRKTAAHAKEGRLTATLFACSPGGRSYEWNEKRHGFFSYHFIQGLRGKAADAKGRITYHSLVAYLEQAVPASSDRVLGKQQVPWGETKGAGASTWTLATAGGGHGSASRPQAAQTPETEAPEPASARETPSPTPAPGNKQTLEGGLVMEDIVVGSGDMAATGNHVKVHYTGWLTNGQKFDSSLDRGQPFSFDLGARQVIKGWDQGVVGMRVGGRRRLTIPPQLGYDTRGAGNVIPPNATLIFEVELLEVGRP